MFFFFEKKLRSNVSKKCPHAGPACLHDSGACTNVFAQKNDGKNHDFSGFLSKAHIL